MNTTNVSYDLYGTNYQSKLATRYDHKSQSSASLYGSRVSFNLMKWSIFILILSIEEIDTSTTKTRASWNEKAEAFV